MLRITVIGEEEAGKELTAQGTNNKATVSFSSALDDAPECDCCIDLAFKYDEKRISKLKAITSDLIIVNGVNAQERPIPSSFILVNAWNTFLARPIIEAATENETLKEKAEKIFAVFNKTVEWVPAVNGLITPRVVSMIINEAYHALGENVSERNEIDTAMKLGTNYPFGPFEWAEKIGVKNIYSLLLTLSASDRRYKPAPLLEKEFIS